MGSLKIQNITYQGHVWDKKYAMKFPHFMILVVWIEVSGLRSQITMLRLQTHWR